MFFILVPELFCNEILCIKKNLRSINTHTGDYGRPTEAIWFTSNNYCIIIKSIKEGGYTLQLLFMQQILHGVCHMNVTCCIQIFLKKEDPPGLNTTLFT